MKYKVLPICLHLNPRNSGLFGASIAHTIRPVKKKKATIANHRFFVSGCKKIHIVDFLSFLTSTSIDTPDSV